MAKARKILARANAIRKIRTVTKTMELVATARFRQAQNRARNLRPYTQRATDMVADLVHRQPDRMHHPLIDGAGGEQRDVLLTLTSNRGLCGAYNGNVLKIARQRRGQLVEAGYDVCMHVAGKKGISAMRQAGEAMEATYAEFDTAPEFHVVAALCDELLQRFRAGEIEGVEVAYMQYLSSTDQRPAIAQILPLSNLELPPRPPTAEMDLQPYEFIPSAEEILDDLLPALVRVRMHQCFVDADVSEQSARMSAMRSASDNADEMIRDLMTDYNRTRQGQITNELAEIIGGSEGGGR